MKHGWVMYLFLLILIGIMLRNPAGSVGILLGGSQAASGFTTTLQGPNNATSGSVSFNNGSKVTF